MQKRKNRRIPSYLSWSGYSYLFRIAIPTKLQAIIGKKELKYSLKTGSLALATKRARIVAGSIQLLFDQLRSGMVELSNEQIEHLVRIYVQQSLDEDESYMGSAKEPLSEQQLDEIRYEILHQIRLRQNELLSWDNSFARSETDKFIARNDIHIDPASDVYGRLVRAILRAHIRVLNMESAIINGNYPKAPYSESPSVEKLDEIPPFLKSKPEEAGHNFQSIIEKYFHECERAGIWSPRTVKDYSAGADLLLKFTGDVPVKSLDENVLQRYKETLLKLPKNFTNSKKYSKVSLHDLPALADPDNRLSVSAINRYLMVAKAIFDYAKKNGYIEKAPGEVSSIKKKSRPDKERDIFSPVDLKLLFSSPAYQNDKHREPNQFWLPLLGLYTGARLEELCQLHVTDVKQVDAVWVIDLNDAGDKRLKNSSSVRLIPLHPVLTEDLKFPEFVARLKASGKTRIFDELKKIQHQYGHYPSRWFSKYQAKCGITAGKKSYHSFRHTFTDHLKQKGADAVVIDELTGHSVPGESLGRYGKRLTPKALVEMGISKLEFSLEIEHIKRSRFVGGAE